YRVAAAFRFAGPARALARSAATRRNPVVLCDERAGCRLVGPDTAADEHGPRRRRVGTQRPQVVHHRRRASSVPPGARRRPERRHGGARGGPPPPSLDRTGGGGHLGPGGRKQTFSGGPSG